MSLWNNIYKNFDIPFTFTASCFIKRILSLKIFMNSVMGFKIDVINNNVSSRDPVRIIPVSGYVTYYLKR